MPMAKEWWEIALDIGSDLYSAYDSSNKKGSTGPVASGDDYGKSLDNSGSGGWVNTALQLGKSAAPYIAGGIQQNQENNRREDFSSLMGRAGEQDYADQMAQYNYQQQVSAANQANAAARAAAARRTDENRRAAMRQGLKKETARNKQARATLDPFYQTGKRLLPEVEKTYGQGLASMQMLNAYLNQPSQVSKLSMSAPAASLQFKLPDYLKGK